MKHLLISFSLLFSLHASGQELNVESNKLTPYIQSLYSFSKKIPQEKVYLHFDNTSYYQGDNIWFACYVTSGQNRLSQLSKTLYVELLNPGGEIIDKRILLIENGRCHGDFTLNHLPSYSGFYEVRAYTKYMLNFGEDVIFSRLLPVFNKPKIEGNYEEKEMLKYGRYGPIGYQMNRKNPEKEKSVNVRFFSEGGNLIQGVPSRVAFEATDEIGNPIDITGVVMDEKKQELCRFESFYEGRGTFTFTPSGAGKQKAEVNCTGKKYQFDLPAVLPQGIVMEVDNLSYPDSIGITLRRSELFPAETLGVVVLNGGMYQSYRFVSIQDDEINFKIDKTKLPSGVSQIVLFSNQGEILCDRLIFVGKNDFLNIQVKTDKSTYKPYEPINMEISIADKQANPVQSVFSLSVRDAANEVEYKQNILTDLLLMSEIKGYVHNPAYYFESDDTIHRRALDLLLMVQGWRRYSWKQMAGIEPLELKSLPEQGIGIDGKVVSFVRKIPKPNVDVSLLLLQKRDEEPLASINGSTVTDNQGRFSFTSDVYGKWSLILSVAEKRKRKDHRILLDRVFSPDPKRYRYSDLQISIAGKNTENGNYEEKTDSLNEDLDPFFVAYQDSLIKTDTNKKIHSLPEVTVKAKSNREEQDIRRNRSTSVAYYDVPAEFDNIYDKGKYIGDDIHDLLINMNKDFSTRFDPNNHIQNKSLFYKGKAALIVVNYKPVKWNTPDLFAYQTIRLSAIKSIYINENPSVIAQYLITDPFTQPSQATLAIRFYSCVVFIETYPDGEIPAEGEKGVRKTWLDGYSDVKEFYSPDYSAQPEETDYRRTLYWNPAVTADSTGIAKIQFFNSSNCKNISVNAETVTPEGRIGVN